MREILEHSNLALLYEIDLLISALPSKETIADELLTYYDQIYESARQLRQKVLQSLSDLRKQRKQLFIDILSNTQIYTREFHLLNYRLVIPLRRYRPSDQLCLKMIRWLHTIHPQTRSTPGAFCDGDVGIYPSLKYPITYFMPTSAQYGLLYLPLFFHEFGHLLYACHKPELDELVIDLQKELASLLEPVVKRDDQQAKQEAQKRQIIIHTWFTWSQELFCDAVGFQIGGLCFVNAFSMYLKMWGSDRFSLAFENLVCSSHPVAWLRIKLLCEYLRQSGLEEYAHKLEIEWKSIADALSIKEDYFGFYNEEFLTPIMATIHDMLIETEPYKLKPEKLADMGSANQNISPIQLLNSAWLKFHENPEAYKNWEQEAVSIFSNQLE